MNSTNITNVSSLFLNIYRITTADGIILDIYEETKPIIGDMFEYVFGTMLVDKKSEMNGYVFKNQDNYTYISFGGLIGKFPTSIIKANIGDNVFLCYKNN